MVCPPDPAGPINEPTYYSLPDVKCGTGSGAIWKTVYSFTVDDRIPNPTSVCFSCWGVMTGSSGQDSVKVTVNGIDKFHSHNYPPKTTWNYRYADSGYSNTFTLVEGDVVIIRVKNDYYGYWHVCVKDIFITGHDIPTGTNFKINIGDTWKEATAMKINIGDTWKEVVGIQQNIGDTWKTVF